MEKNDYVAQNTQIRRTRSYGSNNTRGSLDDISIATFDEVNNISAMLKEKGIKATLLTKSQANETSFKALSGKDIGVLHIATHGSIGLMKMKRKVLFKTIYARHQCP